MTRPTTVLPGRYPERFRRQKRNISSATESPVHTISTVPTASSPATTCPPSPQYSPVWA